MARQYGPGSSPTDPETNSHGVTEVERTESTLRLYQRYRRETPGDEKSDAERELEVKLEALRGDAE